MINALPPIRPVKCSNGLDTSNDILKLRTGGAELVSVITLYLDKYYLLKWTFAFQIQQPKLSRSLEIVPL